MLLLFVKREARAKKVRATAIEKHLCREAGNDRQCFFDPCLIQRRKRMNERRNSRSFDLGTEKNTLNIGREGKRKSVCQSPWSSLRPFFSFKQKESKMVQATETREQNKEERHEIDGSRRGKNGWLSISFLFLFHCPCIHPLKGQHNTNKWKHRKKNRESEKRCENEQEREH